MKLFIKSLPFTSLSLRDNSAYSICVYMERSVGGGGGERQREGERVREREGERGREGEKEGERMGTGRGSVIYGSSPLVPELPVGCPCSLKPRTPTQRARPEGDYIHAQYTRM